MPLNSGNGFVRCAFGRPRSPLSVYPSVAHGFGGVASERRQSVRMCAQGWGEREVVVKSGADRPLLDEWQEVPEVQARTLDAPCDRPCL